MMRRVLGNHPDIYMLEELHFFEQLWSSSDKQKELSKDKAIDLASRLLFIQRNGYLSELDLNTHRAEAENIVSAIKNLYPHEILKTFLFYETEKNGKIIPCEKTPQDVFYISEILELFPSAKIINMVRDPRGVMLSQKRKWQRKNMGASFMTKKEQRRLRINYHPITISKLWNASLRAALKFKDEPKMHTVHFEKLVNDSENEIKKLCAFLETDFNNAMLMIPQVGSSNEADKPDVFGIKTERALNWEKGGLNAGEIFFCQRICKEYMHENGYEIKKVNAGLYYPVYYFISFPVKLFFALVLNFHRMKNIREAIKKRLK